jgi:galactoside O-acetyltransferase
MKKIDVQKIIKSGELYNCEIETLDSELFEMRMNCKELLYDFNHSRPSEIQKRSEILKKVVAEIGEGCYIEPPFNANWGCNVHIGNNFYANFNLTVVDDTDIYIGNDVMIAPNVVLATGTHPVSPELRAPAHQYNLPIHIGNRVWIGAGAVVLPGVTIGDGSVIGAGSVVTRDIPAGVVAVGSPCRVLREITDEDLKKYKEQLK